ncbi:MFS transporter [Bradyrhizobium icense]|uniref:MFS transporter n=1 Tax=Bradyrhizobium icense TaxID=1274631 RepID=A0A1B1UQK8_9BRAD|nr:MFS transporter [Bradyrhizobium icense]ANW05110.1 MFS transporter [Bradyrhizobium icense]
MTEPPKRSDSITAPLRHAVFRRIWLASLLSNLGILIQGVGAAWAMTQMTSSADKVALVQTALMLPVMLISMPAGAIADMHDRRIVALVSLGIALVGATALTVLAWLGLVTPNILLALCFVVGSGMALFGPAWQASVSEQVPAETLPAAVALNGISYNIARSFGPAIGGIVVATAGAVAAFAVNAVLYLPLMVVLFLWNRANEPSRLPRERLNRAMVSGVRYITNSPSIKIVLTRTLVTGIIGGSVSALMPLVARDLLHGGAQTYGIMLGAFGMGAVFGALNIGEVRRRMSGEAAVRACAISMAGAIAAVALSTNAVLTAIALVLAGAVWMLAVALFNIGVQLSAPRWVAGRSLAAFQASIAGGIAVGSWGWGHLTDLAGVEIALLVSAGLMLISPLLGIWLRMPPVGARNEDATELLADPEVRLSLTGRSGPLVVEIEYRVAQDNARAFHNVMQEVQLSRQRNGAYGWSIARDIGDPELWTERYHCPTWLDYLRQRNRATQSERALHQRAIDFHLGPEPIRVRRMLERPFGSVRWKEDTPDRAANEVLPVVATAAGSST